MKSPENINSSKDGIIKKVEEEKFIVTNGNGSIEKIKDKAISVGKEVGEQIEKEVITVKNDLGITLGNVKKAIKNHPTVVDKIETNFFDLAYRTYMYGFSLVLMDYTKKTNTNVVSPNDWGLAPINQVGRVRQFRDASYRTVVKGNVDTYYTPTWMDLTKGPMVLTIPNTVVENTVTTTTKVNNTAYTTTNTTKNNRFFMMPFMDAYSNVFESLGTRTTGAEAGVYLIVPPGWQAKGIDDITSAYHKDNKKEIGSIGLNKIGRWNRSDIKSMQRIHAPTNMIWMLGRFQVNSTQDGQEIVWPLQDGVTLVPLSEYGSVMPAPLGSVDSTINPIPLDAVKALTMEAFINKMTDLMVDNPYPERDEDFITEIGRTLNIHITTQGATWDRRRFTEEQNLALDTIPDLAIQSMEAMQKTGTPSIAHEALNDNKNYGVSDGASRNGWFFVSNNIGEYGTHYTQRAFIAFAGLGANLKEDALYPAILTESDGTLLDSRKNYTVTFKSGQLPPVNAFWSLTMYGSQDYLVANSLNRYSLGSRSDLVFESNGDLVLYVQSQQPSSGSGIPVSNWLPAATDVADAGGMTLMLRLYWPKQEVFDLAWNFPVVALNPLTTT